MVEIEEESLDIKDLGRQKAFCVQRNKCIVQPVKELQIWCSNRLSDIWPTIASITVWNIWKSRCKVDFVGEESRPKEISIVLWYDLITNIWAQYEELEGTSHMVEVARLSFQQSWSNSPLVDYIDGVPKWCYTMPKRLFPPWQSNQEGTCYFS